MHNVVRGCAEFLPIWVVDESAEKENVNYSRHRNTSFIERKKIPTNMLLKLFTAISAPWDVYVAECKQFGVCIAGDDFFETSNLPRSSSVKIRRKIYSLRMWMVFCVIHCNRCPLQCLRTGMETVSLHALASLKQTWTTCIVQLIFPFHFFEQFGEHWSMIRQISKQKANPVSHKKICMRVRARQSW